MAEDESSPELILTDTEPRVSIDACWQRIGVWASNGATCPALEEVVHCRNCPTYVRAGRRCLTGQPLADADEMQKSSELYRQAKTQGETGLHQVTLFRLGREWFALDTGIVGSVLKPQPSCWVPHRSSRGVKGVVNIDGDALVVVSLPKLLGITAGHQMQATHGQDRTSKVYPRMLTLGSANKPLVVEVDEVWGQARYARDNVIALPSTVNKAVHKYSVGLLKLEGKLVGLLDATLLIYGLEQAMK